MILTEENVHRVEFEATLQDFVDVQSRILKRSAVARSWWRRDAIVMTAISGLAMFVVLGLVTPLSPITFRLVVSLLWMLLFPFFWKQLYHSQSSLRTEQWVRERLGDGPIPVVIELRRQGAWVRQANVELLFDWRDGTSVDETADGVELCFRTGGLIVARDRGFAGTAHRGAFVERARELMRAHDPALRAFP